MSTSFSKPFSAFLSDTSGAVTVDWVVLAAAVTGLGIASVSAVGSGVGTLAVNVDAALSGASVSLLCQPAAYEMRYFAGDRAEDALRYAEEISQMSDENVLNNYSEAARKYEAVRDGNEGDERLAEILDVVALYNAEIEARRLEPATDAPSFSSLSGADACSGGGSGATGGYELLAYNTRDSGRDADGFRNEISRYESEQIAAIFGEFEVTFYEALENGDEEKARILLDQMYMTMQEIATREDLRRRRPDVENHFQSAFETYQASLR